MLEFDQFPLVAADLRRFDQRCVASSRSANASLSAFRQLYSPPFRSLVVDGSANTRGANGIGNYFGDFCVWIALAAASRRALFIGWTRGDGQRSVSRYELLRFFTGVGSEDTDADGWEHSTIGRSLGMAGGLDWAWNAANRERLHRSGLRPAAYDWDATVPCNVSASLLWSRLSSEDAHVRINIPANQGIALIPMCASGAATAAIDSDKASARTFDAMHGAIKAAMRRDGPEMDKSMKALAAVLGEAGMGDLMQLATWGMALSTAWALSADADSHVSMGELLQVVSEMIVGERLQSRSGSDSVEARLRTATSWRGGHPRTWSIFLLSTRQDNEMGHVMGCLLHSMMRPRRTLQEALLPLLRSTRNATTLVTLHVRSGWADDTEFLSLKLEGRVVDRLSGPEAAAVQVFTHALASHGADALTCSELPREQREALHACGQACLAQRQPPSDANYFREGLRELLASPPASLYPHPSAALTNVSARLELMGWDFARPGSRHALAKLEEKLVASCGPPAPGAPSLLDQPRAAENGTFFLPSPLATAAHCISRTARRLAATDEWAVAISSDAPGLRELLLHWPGFGGRALRCARCDQPPSHSQRTSSDSTQSLGLSIELWLHGASAALLPLVHSTLTSYAIRSRNLLSWPVAHPSKRLDMCNNLPASARRGFDRGERNQPTGSCKALKWLGYGWLSARALSNDTIATQLALAVAAFRQKVGKAVPYAVARGNHTIVAHHCVEWPAASCSGSGAGPRCGETYEAVAPLRYVLPTANVSNTEKEA